MLSFELRVLHLFGIYVMTAIASILLLSFIYTSAVSECIVTLSIQIRKVTYIYIKVYIHFHVEVILVLFAGHSRGSGFATFCSPSTTSGSCSHNPHCTCSSTSSRAKCSTSGPFPSGWQYIPMLDLDISECMALIHYIKHGSKEPV